MGRQIIVKDLPEASRVVTQMKLAAPDEWTGEYPDAAWSTVAWVLEEQMEEQGAGHLS